MLLLIRVTVNSYIGVGGMGGAYHPVRNLTIVSENLFFRKLGFPKIGFPQNVITIAAAIGQGIGIINSVKKAVASTKANVSTNTPTPNVSSPSTNSLPPAFNIVGASETNQLADAIGGQTQEPTRAYVVATDVSTAQELDRNIIEGASIG